MAREKVFRFKQFDLLNDKTAMKVGTDGVLVGAWCDVTEAKQVLDVGTGCGLIALMVAQRTRDATIKAIDLDQDAIIEAKENIANSPWSSRVEAIVADFNDYAAQEPFDLIVSNPPFFTENVMAPDQQRTMARHTLSLNYEQLISKACRLLSERGIISIITPVEAEKEIRRCVVQNNLSIGRLARVSSIVGNQPKRIMWELSKLSVTTSVEEFSICNSDRSYSSRYVALTGDFYLNL